MKKLKLILDILPAVKRMDWDTAKENHLIQIYAFFQVKISLIKQNNNWKLEKNNNRICLKIGLAV